MGKKHFDRNNILLHITYLQIHIFSPLYLNQLPAQFILLTHLPRQLPSTATSKGQKYKTKILEWFKTTVTML